MNITKKFDRAFQWAGEKMGSEAKTNMTDDFKNLETEMALRFDGMERLQKSMNAYVKWLGRRNETFEDKEKGLPVSYLGRTMVSHGEDFEPDSEFGNCLIAFGRANENVSAIQDQFVADATSFWLESLERNLAMMKDYQAARKKLENRRLAYDASISKMQKARRDDFRIEEEVRTNKAKYEETTEDVARRMQDIRDAEADSVRDMTSFLDSELEYHERCAEELRRTRQAWAGSSSAAYHQSSPPRSRPSAAGGRGRSNTATTLSRTSTNGSNSNHSNHSPGRDGHAYGGYDDHEPAPPVRMPPIRSAASRSGPDMPLHPTLGRSNTVQSTTNGSVGSIRGQLQQQSSAMAPAHVTNLRSQLRPVSRIVTPQDNVFADDDSLPSSGGVSPESWGPTSCSSENRSASPATSFGSGVSGVSRSTTSTTLGSRKAPPPPPPSRAKKPAPPIPARREVLY